MAEEKGQLQVEWLGMHPYNKTQKAVSRVTQKFGEE